MPIFTHVSINTENENRTKTEADEFNRILKIVKAHYERTSYDDLQKYMERYTIILDRVPENALLVVILPNYLQNKSGNPELVTEQAAINEVFKVVGKDRPNVRFIEMTSLLETIDDVSEVFQLHFRRAVYRRLFESIEQRYVDWIKDQTQPDKRDQFDRRDQSKKTDLELPYAQKQDLAVA